MPLPQIALASGAKPLEPFGKGSNALKAGTPDAEPEGSTAFLTRPSVQPPAGVERKPHIYAAGPETQAARDPGSDRRRSLDRAEIAVSFAPFTGHAE
jgi:hypothetical protein